MLDGEKETADPEKTEESRAFVRSFVDEVLVNGRLDRLGHYVDSENYIEHNPRMADGLPSLRASLAGNDRARSYDKIHRLLAEGSFVLCVTEGSLDGVHVSFYDLFRVAEGKIVEHWDTVDEVPPRSEWVNDNGKF